MKKTILLLAVITVVSSSCLKKKTCTCKAGSTVMYTESSTDWQKVQTDCNTAEAQANGPGATITTVCTVQ